MRVVDLTDAGCDLVGAVLPHVDPGPSPGAFIVTEEQIDGYRDTLWTRWRDSKEFRDKFSDAPVPSRHPPRLWGVPLVSEANAHPALRAAARAQG